MTSDRHEPPAAEGRTVAITGGSAGVGLWTVLRLAEAGADTVLLCRNPDKRERAADAVRSEMLGAGRSVQALRDGHTATS